MGGYDPTTPDTPSGEGIDSCYESKADFGDVPSPTQGRHSCPSRSITLVIFCTASAIDRFRTFRLSATNF